MSRHTTKRQPRRHRASSGKRGLFIGRAAQILDVSERAIVELFTTTRTASVRVNRLSPRPAASIVQELHRRDVAIEPLAWCPDAYALHSPKHELGQSDLFADGHVYIQSASSLLPALALDPQPGEAILDVCAAPGGKASHIAAIVAGDCELWLNDPIKPRRERMEEVVATLGVKPANVTGLAGQYLDKSIERRFDRILLDAQCSGEGRVDLRRGDALSLWSTARVERYSRLQQRMLVSAFKLLEPGGTLVYSTCTLAPEENEAPVSHLLNHHPSASLAPIAPAIERARPALRSWDGKTFHPALKHARRIVPDAQMEAFFVAKIVKSER